jgi:hypothetical protein
LRSKDCAVPNTQNENRSDWLGSLIGLLTFVGGIGLLALTFQLAFQLYSVPPETALAGEGSNAVDLAKAGESFGGVVVKIFLLLVMSVVGSTVANRGIRLYVTCRSPQPKPPEKPERAEAAAEAVSR